MARYGYLTVICRSDSLEIRCTEPTTVQWFIDQKNEAFPAASLRVHNCQADHPYWAQAMGMNVLEVRSIAAWLTRELCHAGWQPFEGVLGQATSFRKTLE